LRPSPFSLEEGEKLEAIHSYLEEGERLDLLLPQEPRDRVEGRRLGCMLPTHHRCFSA
jgi:hypothetical protein